MAQTFSASSIAIDRCLMQFKRILVTGSTGLLGSQVIRDLTQRYPELQVRAVYHQTVPWYHAPQIEYVQADLTHPESASDLAQSCDAAVLCASNTGGASSLVSEPWRQVTDNICMQVQLFQALAQAGVKKTIFISSAIVYHSSEERLKESDLDLNLSPHPAYMGIAWVLRYLEKLCEFWHQQTGMEFIILRAANIFGPYDRFDPAFSNFIPALIRKTVEQMEPFEVWGRPDVIRDVIYVSDFVSALMGLLELNKILGVTTLNLGSGQKTSVQDVVEWVTDSAGFQPKNISFDLTKPATSRARVLDCEKIKQLINWEPEHTVQQGIQETLDWWQNNNTWWKK